MFLRRYLEYPGRKVPGFLSLTLICLGTFILIEILVQFKSRDSVLIQEKSEQLRNVHRISLQREQEAQRIADLDSDKLNYPLEGGIKEDIDFDLDATFDDKGYAYRDLNEEIVEGPKKERLLTMVVVLCTSNSENASDVLFGIERQVRQARVSLKSAVYLSKDPIKFIVISNSNEIFPKIQELVRSWPEEQSRKVTLEFAPSFYPEQYKMMKEMFRPCSTQRLFLEQVLPNEDAILYIDTDVVFMRSPGDAWDLFDKFGEKQMIAAAGPSFMFIQRAQDPVMKQFFEFEGRGFNAGILLFNLTRIRNSPHVWDYQILVSSKLVYFEQIMDQDILNFMCNQYPKYCYKLDCEWNFRWSFCSNFSDRCPNILKNGPNLVHGIGGAFANPKHPKMVLIYEEFDKWDMAEPISKLITTLQTLLPNTTARTGHCSKVPGIDEALLKQLVRSASLL